MTLIIDGYNLLHASGVFGAGRGPRGFEESRRALLDLLADWLGDDAGDCLVVFDAARAPDGLPGRLVHRGIRVWFAREYPDADSLIEELVAGDDAPGSLVVVSGDRRLQAAARKRRATAVAPEQWLAERRAIARAARRPAEGKPPPPEAPDVAEWKRYFGLD